MEIPLTGQLPILQAIPLQHQLIILHGIPLLHQLATQLLPICLQPPPTGPLRRQLEPHLAQERALRDG